MAGSNIPSGNVFDNLPDVLIDDILMQCSPTDRIRAAAACQALFNVYDEFRKQLTSQSVTINGSSDGGVLLSPHNIGKLHMKLENHECVDYDCQIYNKLESFIGGIRGHGVLHLSNVHALRINLCLTSPTAQRCIQLLLQLLPNLKSIWFDQYGSLTLLSRLHLQSISGICKLALPVGKNSMSVSRLPALLPNLHTLCLAAYRPLLNKWWQPLSLMSRLRCLSLYLYEEQHNLSGLHHLTTLRHLKLETYKVVDMRSISGLTQLKSLCLCGVEVSYPAALSNLKVTSLALQSVRMSQPQTQLLHCEAQQQQLAEPYWPKLTRVQLAWGVSEQLLQAMLLPPPAAAGMTVKLSLDTFDDFDSGSTQVYKATFKINAHYPANTTPILEAEHFAVARKVPEKVRSPRLHGRLDKPRSVADHVGHDVGKGIKTRDKPSSRQAIILLYQAGRCCVSAAAILLCLILFFVFWYIFKLFVEQVDATNKKGAGHSCWLLVCRCNNHACILAQAFVEHFGCIQM